MPDHFKYQWPSLYNQGTAAQVRHNMNVAYLVKIKGLDSALFCIGTKGKPGLHSLDVGFPAHVTFEGSGCQILILLMSQGSMGLLLKYKTKYFFSYVEHVRK